MKRYWSRLLALVLVVTLGLMGCTESPDSLTGDYRQDTLAVVNVMKEALDLTADSPDRAAIQAEARQKINDFSARYQRDNSVSSLSSFTTMRTDSQLPRWSLQFLPKSSRTPKAQNSSRARVSTGRNCAEAWGLTIGSSIVKSQKSRVLGFYS